MRAPKIQVVVWLCLGAACRPTAPPRAEPKPPVAPAPAVVAPGPSATADAAAAPPELPVTEPGTIPREHIDRITARGPAWLLRQLAPEPYRPRGRFEGWEITAVFPDAPEFCTPACDLRPGDVIVSVAGDSLETPDAFAAMFERAESLQALRVVRLRAGVRETIEYRIVPTPLPGGRAPG